MKNLLEICAANYQSAMHAQEGGADRIELCVNLQEGGETPSFGLMKRVREDLQIQMNVLIRPRPGSFVYKPHEVEIMLHDIEQCKALGVDGVVIGALTAEGEIDMDVTRKLIEKAGEMKITFHRAIDVAKDMVGEMEKIKSLGVDTILTSGGAKKAIDGKENMMHQQLQGKVTVMAGSGINADNVELLATFAGINTFHASASSVFSESVYHQKGNLLFGKENHSNEYQYFQSEVEKIRQLKQRLNQLPDLD